MQIIVTGLWEVQKEERHSCEGNPHLGGELFPLLPTH